GTARTSALRILIVAGRPYDTASAGRPRPLASSETALRRSTVRPYNKVPVNSQGASTTGLLALTPISAPPRVTTADTLPVTASARTGYGSVRCASTSVRAREPG